MSYYSYFVLVLGKTFTILTNHKEFLRNADSDCSGLYIPPVVFF